MDIKLNRGMPGIPQIPTQLPTLLLLLLLGGASIGFGVLLIFNPWLLQWLVAGLFILVGAVLLLTGLRAKRLVG